MKKYKFVDLFSGIGGFYQALTNLGCKCVGASEIDKKAIERYKTNFPNIEMFGDINKCYNQLPEFDILCGGFPCQPFSKAGKQKGFEDETRGNLFYRIMDILDLHPECKFVVLENVKNLADKSENWNVIQSEFKKRNFYITESPIILSPHQFGIPQIRERVYILGIRKDIRDEKKLPNAAIHMEDLVDLLSEGSLCSGNDAFKILGECNNQTYFLSKEKENVLKIWFDFKAKTNFDVPGVPIWVVYFGYNLNDEQFLQFVDHKGQTINDMPDRKRRFAIKNRNFYLKHKKFIDKWIEKNKIMELPLCYKKFEWNCGDSKNFEDIIVQFRQSGIRVKKANYFPALVAINNTPIVFDKTHRRYRKITPREAANLQSFNENYILGSDDEIYKQLGNAVNVKIIEKVVKKLLSFERN